MKTAKIKEIEISCDDLPFFFLSPEKLNNKLYSKINCNLGYLKYHEERVKHSQNIPWSGWAFRGQAKKEWKLKPSLIRNFESFGIDIKKYREKENALLREFQRSFHLYSNHHIDEGDYYEWFSIMQHSFAPTRFVDFTYSPFVATFFAIENLVFNEPNEFVIWCIDITWLEYKYKSFLNENLSELFSKDPLGKSIEIQKALFTTEHSKNTVINVNPFHLNERLLIQQGLFLFPTDLSTSTDDLLLTMIESEEEKYKAFKLIVHYDPEKIMKLLNFMEKININRRTLFPGIDGFASSLKLKVAATWLTPDLNEKTGIY